MLKTFAAITLGKLIFFLSRFLGFGGGFAAPGLYALKIEPDLVSKLISHKAINIVITGTNGKTTTSKLISHFLSKSSFKVIRNSSGSNLERGIASYLVKHANFSDKLDYNFGVWELDEFAFNQVAQKIKPSVIVLLNALRDQLDRYGEVDKVVGLWQQTLSKFGKDTILILNQDDGNLVKAAKGFKGKIITFGVKGIKISGEGKYKNSQAADFEAEISGEQLRSRNPEEKLKNSFESSLIIRSGKALNKFNLPLPGVFNIYNFLASFIVAGLFKVESTVIEKSLKSFIPAFGRFEKIEVKGKKASIFLIKNPVGATQVLQTILPHLKQQDCLLLALNDNLADGQDVSWIWDINLEKLKMQNAKCKVFISGQRTYDLALRLKYAGLLIKRSQLIPELDKAFDKSINEAKGNLYILPTYTALLKLQKILVKKGIKKEYWRE